MATSLPWSVKGVDPRTRDAAKAAARRAGMTLGEWLDSKIRIEAVELEAPAAAAPAAQPPEQLDIAALSERLARLSQGEMQTTPAPEPRPRAQSRADLSRAELDAFITQAAMAERLSRDTGARTAGALDSIAQWIEKTEQRLAASERVTAERQERATTVIADAIKTMGERLNEIERRAVEPARAPAAAASAASAASERGTRPYLSREGLAAAVSDIRARQRALDDEPAGASEREAPARTLAGLREELRALSVRLPQAQPAPSPEDQRAAFRPLERAIGDLGTRIERLDGRDRLDSVLKPLARMEAEIARLGDGRSADNLDRFELEIAHLAAKVDALVARGGDQALVAPLLREIRELRAEASAQTGGARFDDISRQLGALSGEIGQLRETQPAARELRTLSDAIQDVRETLLSDRTQGADAKPLAALSRQVESLAQKLDTLPAMKPAVIEGQIAQLIARLDEMQALGRPASDALSERIEALVIRLEDLTERSSDVLGSRLDALQQQMEAVSGRDTGAIERQIEALAGRIESLAASHSLAQMVEDGSGPVARVDMRPVEEMLRNLASKIDEAGRPGAGADSFDALERQISRIASRLDEAAATRTAETGIERTLQDLVTHLKTMREDTAAAAERAARAAVADISPARGGSLAQLSDLMSGLHDTHVSSGRQTQDAIGAVQRTLETVIARIGNLEAELAGERDPSQRGQAASQRPVMPGLDRLAVPAAAAPERPASQRPSLESVDLPLEPGSGRPRLDGQSPASPSDPVAVRQSLIAAARRSAKAASEAAASAPSVTPEPARAGKPAQSGGRLKEIMEKRRRPLLLGLAAVVLAMGAAQVMTGSLKDVTPAQDKAGALQATAPQPAAKPTETVGEAPAAPAKDQLAAPSTALPLGTGPAQASGPLSLSGDVTADTPTTVASLPPAAGPEPIAAVTGLGDLPPTLGTAGLRKAALAGDARAVYELATRAADTPGTVRDPQLALKLFERAAVAGLAPAQFRLGNMFEKGIGTTRDPALARVWYGRAAESGNAKAMHNLAVLHAEGVDGKPDYATAAQWFRRAAELGVRDSQYNLAILLGRGLGAPADMAQSYRWFAIAASQGDEDAARKRDEVAARLPAAELAGAKAAAESWKPKALEAVANEVAAPAEGWDSAPTPPKKPARPSRG
ncbi:hypothetical protein ABE438_11730 [Bosea sp. TWI1241]|uniref:hypothetical protein n=1 Tax=Bosea sp. TWI1241 TaxID=3148904 RepID=UPI00320B6E26